MYISAIAEAVQIIVFMHLFLICRNEIDYMCRRRSFNAVEGHKFVCKKKTGK